MADRARSHRLLRHLAAGALGTGALRLSAPLERRIAGGPLPFAPPVIAAALCRLVDVDASRRSTTIMGTLLRWTYGPGWAAVYGAARPRLSRSPVARAATLAAGIAVTEVVALPLLVGRRLLRGRVLAALGAHIGLFAAVVEAALCAVEQPR